MKVCKVCAWTQKKSHRDPRHTRPASWGKRWHSDSYANASWQEPASWRARHKKILKLFPVLPEGRLWSNASVLLGLGGWQQRSHILSILGFTRGSGGKMIAFPQCTPPPWPTWPSSPGNYPPGDRVRGSSFLSGKDCCQSENWAGG